MNAFENSFWQFYSKGELTIHREKNAACSEYTNVTPENVWAISDSVESDYKNDLADVMEDSDTEFVVEDNQEKHEDQDEEDNSLDSHNYNQHHAIVHESTYAVDTNVRNKCTFKENENIGNEIDLTKFANYIKIQNDCKLNSEVLIEIFPLDNSLNVFEKLINFDESERYASQNGRTFVVSLHELWTFIVCYWISQTTDPPILLEIRKSFGACKLCSQSNDKGQT